jgi:hypothetical protein
VAELYESGAMQDDTIAEGRDHLIILFYDHRYSQPNRSAFLLDANTCLHVHIVAAFVLYVTVQYLILFLIDNRLRLTKGSLVFITNNFTSIASVTNHVRNEECYLESRSRGISYMK